MVILEIVQCLLPAEAAKSEVAAARCQGKHCYRIGLVCERERERGSLRRERDGMGGSEEECEREGGSINRLQKERASAH